MDKKDQSKFIYLSITLIAVSIAVIIFVIIPKYFPKPTGSNIEKIDFSSPEWIEQYIEESVEVYGKDFYLNTAFTYNIRSNKMIITYATQKSVEEIRDHYLSLPGAELTGRNDETSLNITVEYEDHTIRVYNFYSPVSRVVELELTLGSSQAEGIINQLEMEFPSEEIDQISEVEDLMKGDVFGGYVRYRYDSLDEYSYPEIPIYSRAYLYEGSEEDFIGIIDDLILTYSDYRYNETQNAHYYKIKGQIMSVGFFVTDSDETVISISLQEDKNQE